MGDTRMLTGKGKSVFAGIGIGKIFLYRKQEFQIRHTFVQDVDIEQSEYEKTAAKAKEQLTALYEKTLAEVGQNEAMIIDVQLMMLEDLDYQEAVEKKIRKEKKNTAWAVSEAGEEFAEMFAAMEDDYMKARAADIRDVAGRLARIACGADTQSLEMPEPVIVVAHDLAPSETVQFEKSKLLGFVIQRGSSNSHTAILARTMGLPSLVSADIAMQEEIDGKWMIVDGHNGMYYIDPDEDTLQEKREQQKKEQEEKELLQALKGLENITRNGQKINVYANIGKPEDIEAVLQNDAGGIGLFRSEFIYLGRDTYPSEEEQFESYRKVVSAMQGKKVIIRTLDIGADKQADYFEIEREDNPAMGYRAIRICLDRTEMFKTQLRAIYRASAYGVVSIMFPMIISVDEIRAAKSLVEEVKGELTREKVPYGKVELGIMIETPAAVMIAEELAREVEFFSVGTNDLTQYTLAIDRQNDHLDAIYDSHHPAVLRMLKMVADSAHSNGIWAGICGELAADLSLTQTFLEMGYDELSVSPAYTLPLRRKIRETTTAKGKDGKENE